MTLKIVGIAAAALVLSTGLSSAAVFDFDFTPSLGTITASGTLTTDNLDLFANIIDISGTVDGVAIQGLAPGVNILHTTGFSTVFDFTDADGVGYEIASFMPPAAFVSSGTSNSTGTLTIKPEELPGVPLPASAPMFGAALLGLAGLGYAAKRKNEAAAA